METTKEQTELRPFHETILETIRRCQSTVEMMCLFKLVNETRISKGHEDIIAAIDQFFSFPGSEKWAPHIREVRKNLLAQKQATATESASVDDIEREIARLIAELNNRHPNLRETIENLRGIRVLIRQAVGG